MNRAYKEALPYIGQCATVYISKPGKYEANPKPVCWVGMTGYPIELEREWAKDGMQRHKANPRLQARPMCIVKVKEVKAL